MKNKKKEYDNQLHPGITMHKIPVKAGFAGVLFTIGVMLACLMGIPAIIYFFVLAIWLGIAVAAMLHFIPRQAGLVIFALTGVMIVCLAVIPGVNESIHEPDRIVEDLHSLIVAPPPPPEGYLSPYPCVGQQHKSKPPRGSQEQPIEDQPGEDQPIKATASERLAQAAFDGTWEGRANGLPAVALSVADAGGGQIGGVVTFYFQTRENEHSPWHVAGKAAAPLLAAHMEGKALTFEVQHHKSHNSPEFGPNAKFRMELSDDREALLYNLNEPAMGAFRLMRQE